MSSKRKIAIISTGDLPIPAVQGGAVENLIENLLNENEQRQIYEFIVYSSFNRKALAEINKYKCSSFRFIKNEGFISFLSRFYYKVKTTISNSYQGNYYINKVAKFINCEKIPFDYIIIENMPVYSVVLKKKCSVPIIQHLHNSYIHNSTKFLYEIFNSTKEWLCVSKYIESEVMATAKSLHLNVSCHVWYNGIRPMKRLTNIEATSFKKKLGFSKNDFICIFTGRIVPYKGIRELLAAFQSISENNIKLLILGAPVFSLKKRTPFLNEIIASCNKQKNKVFFAGYVPYDEIENYYSIADIACLPSIWQEPFGATIIESMFVGVPLITTSVGGIPEIIGESDVIMLNTGKDLSSEIKKAILKLYTNPELRQIMAESGMRRATQFTSEKYYKRFTENIQLIEKQ